MDRRQFLGKGAMALLAVQAGESIFTACTKAESMSKKPVVTPGNKPSVDPSKLKIRFLGTGAADWTKATYRGEHRNFSSILVDDDFLIDYTSMSNSMLPEGAAPTTIFYTHSHADHFNAADALNLGITKVYVGSSWYLTCKQRFQSAANSTGKSMPSIIGVELFQTYKEGDVEVIPLPANHGTAILEEQTLIYLLVKKNARVLYATDTGGIMARGAQFAGFDDSCSTKKPLTGLIMEATMGLGRDEDFRIFTHSSVELVQRTRNMLVNYKLLTTDMPVYTTHMARTLHPVYEDQLKTYPDGLLPAYDGLELEYPTA